MMKNINTLAKKSIYEPTASGKPGLTAEYFDNKNLEGAPAVTRDDASISFDWKGKTQPANEIKNRAFSARWTGTIKPATSGKYAFVMKSDDGSRVKLDGKEIINMWQEQDGQTNSAMVDLEAGKSYKLVVEYFNSWGDANVRFAYVPVPPLMPDDARNSLASADAAIVCVRTTDSEGSDRPYALSSEQVDYIKAAAAVNPHTIVVLESGGNVAMKEWIDQVPALVDAMYPGQAGGKAIAEVLFGDVNPSGHLPDTFEKDWNDSFAFGNYPGDKTDVKYAEGIYVGYRYYDTKKIEPRFEFGRGLSYTMFDIKNVKATPGTEAGTFTVTADVTNTGARVGATVAQLYVRPPNDEKIDRPMQELKGFSRVTLKPGETQTVSIPLNGRSFSYWDVQSHSWKIIPGEYEIAIGQSSREINGTTKLQVK